MSQLAVITGGSGGLGSAIADSLRAAGLDVMAPSSRELDVRDVEAIRCFFRHKPVDLLVCASGITRDAPLARLAADDWQECWNVNLLGAARCAREVLPGMIERGRGHLVFISSYSAIHPPAGQCAYAAAKAALLGLTADLATRHGPQNIRVNAILPGFLETRMTREVSARRRAEVLQAHALGRLNTCLEVAAFVRFLHHELAHTSGQLFNLDSRANFP